MDFIVKSPSDVQLDIASAFKKKRLALDFSQKSLSERSGVSLGSLKRFEATGEISLNSLLNLALVLGCLDQFNKVCTEQPKAQNMDQLLAQNKQRKRGRK